MYMVHGGSNFGLTAGANAKGQNLYTGTITSYDYDAPINEQGSSNQKFTAFRDLAKKYLPWPIPEPPTLLPTISIPAFKPFRIANMLSNLGEPIVKNSLKTILFETDELQMYDQGMAVYETDIPSGTHTFYMQVSDFALVYLDDNFIGSYDRSQKVEHSFVVTCKDKCKMLVLVEAMGHINFDHEMETDRKGAHSISDKKNTFYWNIYKIDINNEILDWRKLGSRTFPALSKANFNLTSVADTFINVKNYKKGYLWVNGRNLGRYWNVGPT